MSFRITITPANIEFTTRYDEDILSSALAAKINLPHGCKSGNCGACKCKITSGNIVYQDESHSEALSTQEIANGYALLCKAYATSDITIDIPGFTNTFPIRILPSKISSIDKVGTTAIVKLKLPAGQKFDFYAGQYIDIMYEGQNRSYSLANSPLDNRELELHIRYRPGGLFSEAVWNNLSVGNLVRFKGPLGSFTLQNTDKAIIMVCTGTGFAPIKSIIEEMISDNNRRKVHLIWGNFVQDDFYLTELLDIWQTKLNLEVSLCVNENPPLGYNQGLVTDFIIANYPDLSNHEVYACGNPKMIENLYELASKNLHLNPNSFFSDSFTPSK